MIKFVKLVAFATAMVPAAAFAAPVRLDMAAVRTPGQIQKTVEDSANGMDVTVTTRNGGTLGYGETANGLWGVGVDGAGSNWRLNPKEGLTFSFERGVTDLVVELGASAPIGLTIQYTMFNELDQYKIMSFNTFYPTDRPDGITSGNFHAIKFGLNEPIKEFWMFNPLGTASSGPSVAALWYNTADLPVDPIEDLPEITPVPLPAAGFLLGGGVLVMGWLGRRKRRLANL